VVGLFTRTGARAPFFNKDANYLLSCGSEGEEEGGGEERREGGAMLE